jgi:hypothetical protein
MARPSILTDALIARFCSKLRISGSIETAIKATHIGRETYYGWARQVREGGGSVQVKKFIQAVDDAESETKLLREHMLSKHFDKNWQALAWWLERKYSPEYGQRHPPPLADLDEEPERVIERVVWRKAPPVAQMTKLLSAAEAPVTDEPVIDEPVIEQPVAESATAPEETPEAP